MRVGLILGCSAALGMASGEIKDYQITASSSYSETQPNQARPSKIDSLSLLLSPSPESFAGVTVY